MRNFFNNSDLTSTQSSRGTHNYSPSNDTNEMDLIRKKQFRLLMFHEKTRSHQLFYFKIDGYKDIHLITSFYFTKRSYAERSQNFTNQIYPKN